MHSSSERKLLLLAVALISLCAQTAVGQPYPSRPVRLVVPFVAGGGTDALARVVAQHLSKALGGNVLVENRPGAGGTVGSESVAKAAPDGYTLLMGTNATLALAPGLYPKLGYDPVRDFTPISLLANGPNVLVVHSQIPAQDTASFLRYAKANPGKLNYGSAGNGSMAHISTSMFDRAGGVQTVHVPFKGGAAAVQELAAGRLQFMIAGPVETLPLVQSGHLRALAVTSKNRIPSMPHLPPIADTLPGYDIVSWYTVVGPPGLPADIVATLAKHLRDFTGSKDGIDILTRQALEPKPMEGAALREFISVETVKWTREIREIGIAVQ